MEKVRKAGNIILAFTIALSMSLGLFSDGMVSLAAQKSTAGTTSNESTSSTATKKSTSSATKNVRKDRVLFIGDSRTVDIFSEKARSINGKKHNRIKVYAMDGGNINYFNYALKKAGGIGKYDVIVTWMGANDRGEFERYEPYYTKLNKKLKKKGKKLILCTIGPSDESKFVDDGDRMYYNNYLMNLFNRRMTTWAKKNKVQTINLYSYINKNVSIQIHDGVHYIPKPNKKLWEYILKCLKKKKVNY